MAAIVLFGAGCGAVDESAVSDAQSQSDTTVVVDEPSQEATAEPEALALREDDAGTAETSDESTPADTAATSSASVTPPSDSLPPMDELDAGLAEFAVCLNDNGVDVAPFTLQDMLAKATGMPLVETRAEMFGFFLDTDGTTPEFMAAVDVCNPIVDAIPGLGAFLPES